MFLSGAIRASASIPVPASISRASRIQQRWKRINNRFIWQRQDANRAFSTAQHQPATAAQKASPSTSVSPPKSSSTSLSPLFPRTALLFPGQGSQRVGSIVRDLESDFKSIVLPVWEELDEVCKERISRKMKDGDPADIQRTDVAQPAILAHSYAIWSIIQHELGLPRTMDGGAAAFASVALGHSVGEYTALLVAGCIPFDEAVSLVRRRGQAMLHATKPGEGGMLALLSTPSTPLHLPSIAQLLDEVHEETGKVASIANMNSPFQIVLSGHTEALNKVKDRVNNNNHKQNNRSGSSGDSLTRGILKAISLDVSGPFHSTLMHPAFKDLKEVLLDTFFASPSIPIIFNVHAKSSRDPNRFAEYLLAGLTRPVCWHASILHAMQKWNIEQFIELGPSTPLTTMLRQTAARFAKQSPLDPTLHDPADVASARVLATHPSMQQLKLLMPQPGILLNSPTAGSSSGSNSASESSLAGGAAAWQAVSCQGLSGADELRGFLNEAEKKTRGEAVA